MGTSTSNIREEEGFIKDSPLVEPDKIKIDDNIKKCVCKIKTTEKIGSGFFLKFEINEKFYYYLISCGHIITKNIIEKNGTSQIFYDNDLYEIDIKLVGKERFTKNLEDLKLDITVVVIIKSDNINEKYFLSPELNNINKDLNNRRIYILQYLLNQKLNASEGTIKNIDNIEIIHSAGTNYRSSGSPIFLKDSVNVIGIHKERSLIEEENYGQFIYPIFNILKDNVDKMKVNNEKYIYENGNYYIGQIKNDLPNSKGKEYDYYGKLRFEGEYSNDEKNGKCKEYDCYNLRENILMEKDGMENVKNMIMMIK